MIARARAACLERAGYERARRGRGLGSAIALAAAIILTSVTARAVGDEPAPSTVPEPPRSSCGEARENGQRALSRGKLVSARRHFVMCAAEESGCAEPIRSECESSAAELLDVTPTIVIDVQDEGGHALPSATVAVDGEIVEVDGRSIAVDPGEHDVVVQRGADRATQTIVVKERAKAQPFVMRVHHADTEVARDLGGHSVWPWAVVALGGAVALSGVAIAVTAPQVPAGCDASTGACVPLPSETAQAFGQRQDDAKSAESQTIVGVVVAGTGGLIAAGGLLWHFLEPVEPRRTARRERFAPWIGPGIAGVAAAGAF